MDRPSWAPDDVDLDVPSAARTYDYLLGGSHNFAVDREAARKTLQLMPDAESQARENRAFLRRAVHYLVDAGIRQFLDIGSGIPTVGNVHEIAQRLAPQARVVYVDIDPIAVAHSRALLDGNDQATVIQEDLRRPQAILAHPDLQAMLDLDQPVGLLLVAILHAISDQDEPYRLVGTLLDALPAGSNMALSHMTSESTFDQWEAIQSMAERARYPISLRTHAEIERFFTGLELVSPGLVPRPQWRPDPAEGSEGSDRSSSNGYAGVGRKPDTGLATDRTR